MDYSLIAGALSGITSSLGLARTALAVNDFVVANTAITDTLQKLIDLQTQIIASNGAFMELQKQHAALTQLVRKLEEESSDRARYSLFELSPGVFVYRANVAPQTAGSSDPRDPEPVHYLCPRCFDQKVKSVLQTYRKVGVLSIDCVSCKNRFPTGQTVPIPARVLRRSEPLY